MGLEETRQQGYFPAAFFIILGLTMQGEGGWGKAGKTRDQVGSGLVTGHCPIFSSSFFLSFLFGHTAAICGILVPRPRIESVALAVGSTES